MIQQRQTLAAKTTRANMEAITQMGGSPRVVQVLRADMTLLGNGKPENPFRRAHEFYTLDGLMILAIDPYTPAAAPETPAAPADQAAKAAESKAPEIPTSEELSAGVKVASRFSDEMLYRVSQMKDSELSFDPGEVQAIAAELLSLRRSIEDSPIVQFDASNDPSGRTRIIRRAPASLSPMPAGKPAGGSPANAPGRNMAAAIESLPAGSGAAARPGRAGAAPPKPIPAPESGAGAGTSEYETNPFPAKPGEYEPDQK